jgi:hypothetical protein
MALRDQPGLARLSAFSIPGGSARYLPSGHLQLRDTSGLGRDEKMSLCTYIRSQIYVVEN